MWYVFVEGEWDLIWIDKWVSVFWCSNVELCRCLEKLEECECCCDIFVGDEVVFCFYDECIFVEVFDVCLFEVWWCEVMVVMLKLFVMCESDLIDDEECVD